MSARCVAAFTRASDAPPPLLETVDVDADGSWRAWRSNGAVVGRFGAPTGGERVAAATRAAGLAQVPAGVELPPDAVVDRLRIGGDDGPVAAISSSARPDGPWGDAFDACRSLVDEAAGHPVAALGIVAVRADRVTIEHRGAAPITVEFGGARADATVWAPDGSFVAAGAGMLRAGRVAAAPGWSLDVPLEGIDPSTEGELVVSISFVADDGGVYVPVMLAAGRAPG